MHHNMISSVIRNFVPSFKNLCSCSHLARSLNGFTPSNFLPFFPSLLSFLLSFFLPFPFSFILPFISFVINPQLVQSRRDTSPVQESFELRRPAPEKIVSKFEISTTVAIFLLTSCFLNSLKVISL